MPDPPPVLIDVLEEHLEELDLLWERRQSALRSPDYTPSSFASLEGLLQAHFDGLRVGGAAAVSLARTLLPGAEGATAFAAAYTLLRLGDASDHALVIDELRVAEPAAAEGLRHALRHTQVMEKDLLGLLSSERATSRVAAVDALAFRRIPFDADVRDSFRDPDPLVRRMAWQAVGRATTRLDPDHIAAGFDDPEPSVVAAVVESTALMGRSELLAWSRAGARRSSAGDRWAVAALGIIGGLDDHDLLSQASREEQVAEVAVLALGWMGDPRALPGLLSGLENPSLARASGAAIRLITGIDIDAREEGQDDSERPEGDPAEGLNEWPWPDLGRAKALWRARSAEFPAGVRYRRGIRRDQPDPATAPDRQAVLHETLRRSHERKGPPRLDDDPERLVIP